MRSIHAAMNRANRSAATFLLALATLAFSHQVTAADGELSLEHLTNGYRACSWQDNGNGTSTLRLNIDYMAIQGNSAYHFRSRAFLIYTYDKNGNMLPSSDGAISASLNNVKSDFWYMHPTYIVYNGISGNWTMMQWRNEFAFPALLEILVSNEIIKDWPGVSIRAANTTEFYNVAEITGAAYLTPTDDDGACRTIDPDFPPEPDIAIDVTAPDWDLGELPDGEGEKIFSNSADQLCFTYSGPTAGGRKVIVDATNDYNLSGQRYRLRKVGDPSQEIPYDLTLENGVTRLHLPNLVNTGLTLDTAGKTCFAPTFRTTVDQKLRGGTYTDTLTFTIRTPA